MTKRERVAMGLVLSAFLLWQLYAVLLALRAAPRIANLLEGLGGPLPLATRAFLDSYTFWFLVPLVFLIVSIDVVRRESPPLGYFTVTAGLSLLTSLALHAWLDVATTQPLYEIIEAIG